MRHTEVNDVSFKDIFDLRLGDQECCPIRGVPSTTFDVDRDGCSVLNVADVAVVINVGPVFCDFIMEGLEISDSLPLVFRFALICTDLFRILCILPLVCLQLDDLSGPKVSENAMVIDTLLDLVEALLESTLSANSNMVPGCTASVLVLNGGVRTEDMAIC